MFLNMGGGGGNQCPSSRCNSDWRKQPSNLKIKKICLHLSTDRSKDTETICYICRNEYCHFLLSCSCANYFVDGNFGNLSLYYTRTGSEAVNDCLGPLTKSISQFLAQCEKFPLLGPLLHNHNSSLSQMKEKYPSKLLNWNDLQVLWDKAETTWREKKKAKPKAQHEKFCCHLLISL